MAASDLHSDGRDKPARPPTWRLLLGAAGLFLAVAFAVRTLWRQGTGGTPGIDVPSWAHVSPKQIEEAGMRGVPVAFENDLGMRFVLIPAGTFLMGSPEDEEGRGDDETQHEVTLARPFYASIHEVTRGQFRAFLPEHAEIALRAAPGDGGAALDPNVIPMAEVSWKEADEFATWLTAQERTRSYRLPTEAEWEYACRAGTTTSFSWGDAARVGAASYDIGGAFVVGRANDNLGRLPVGSFRPSPWGLYDMHGNVLEWCRDWYAPYPAGAVSDPQGPETARAPRVTTWVRTGEDVRRAWFQARVQRGGGWSQLPGLCRSAARLRGLETDGQDYVGFRLVSPLPEAGGE